VLLLLVQLVCLLRIVCGLALAVRGDDEEGNLVLGHVLEVHLHTRARARLSPTHGARRPYQVVLLHVGDDGLEAELACLTSETVGIVLRCARLRAKEEDRVLFLCAHTHHVFFKNFWYFLEHSPLYLVVHLLHKRARTLGHQAARLGHAQCARLFFFFSSLPRWIIFSLPCCFLLLAMPYLVQVAGAGARTAAVAAAAVEAPNGKGDNRCHDHNCHDKVTRVENAQKRRSCSRRVGSCGSCSSSRCGGRRGSCCRCLGH